MQSVSVPRTHPHNRITVMLSADIDRLYVHTYVHNNSRWHLIIATQKLSAIDDEYGILNLLG